MISSLRSFLPSIVRLIIHVVVWHHELMVQVAMQSATSIFIQNTRDDPHPFFSPRELSLSTAELVQCMLDSGSEYRCIENFRMSRDMFLFLCSLLEPCLKKRVTKKLPVIVQVAIFLDWIAYAHTLREQKEKFKVSHELIEKARNNVGKAIIKVIYPKYVKNIDKVDYSSDYRFKRFNGVLGCVDGSHIPIIVPADKHKQWRNRKGFTSTNGILVCDTEKMVFQFALFGNEGSGSDSTIFKNSAKSMKWLKKGFLLGDAGYGLCKHLLTPYRGVRYHLREFATKESGRPKNMKELFNYRHSSMRIIIERCFGVMKNRFRILSVPLQLSTPEKMWTVMYACVALHNFIRVENEKVDEQIEHDVNEELMNRRYNNESDDESDEDELLLSEKDLKKRKRDEAWRDDIASKMWNDYLQDLSRRRLI